MGVMTVRLCDYCKQECKPVWIEVTAGSNELASFGNVADIGMSPNSDALLFDKPECVSLYFKPNVKTDD